jgi:hypothetical protein
MAVKYKFRRADVDQPWSPARGWLLHSLRVRQAARKLGPGDNYQHRKWSDHHHQGEWSNKTNRESAVKEYLAAVKASHIGVFHSLRSGDRVIVSRTVEVQMKLVDTTGNARVDRAFTEILARWPHTDNWGTCACRDIAGTYDWSQHAYCNAIDVGAQRDTMHAISRYLVANADHLSVHTVIYAREAWSRDRPYWHYYDGVNPHYDHVHVDFDPQGSGYPACA